MMTLEEMIGIFTLVWVVVSLLVIYIYEKIQTPKRIAQWEKEEAERHEIYKKEFAKKFENLY